eukprot:6806795-Pyramimonas_sp.AAC.1
MQRRFSVDSRRFSVGSRRFASTRKGRQTGMGGPSELPQKHRAHAFRTQLGLRDPRLRLGQPGRRQGPC